MFPPCLQQLRLPRSFNSRYKLPFFSLFFSHSSSSTPPFPEGDPNASSSSLWTAAIRSAADAGRPRRALHLYISMLRSGPQPCPFAVAAALKSISRLPPSISPPLTSSFHAHLLKLGLRSHVYPHTALADLYSRLPQSSDAAHKVLDEVPVRNIVSWNSVLSYHLRSGDLHAARKVFDEMPARDVVSWNSMVAGLAKAGDMDRAFALFESIPEKNPASWNGLICGYVCRGNMIKARELFDRMPARNNVSWITMISGYTKSGDVGSAYDLFEQMERKDLYTWNAMIACYAQNGCAREAVRLFNRMRKPDVGVQPNEKTFSCVISACSQLGDLRFGLWVEEYIHSLGIELDDHLGTALLDLYSKCGSMDRAFSLFEVLGKRDVVSYSAMILGCGINGRHSEAFALFKGMLDAKIAPNAVTFVGLLMTYSHAGLVEEAHACFSSMLSVHKVNPTTDHYTIMVDLLGRSGRLEEAFQLIKEMPTQPHVSVWGALLLSCRLHHNVELGEIAAYNCFELEPEESGYYVLLANIYAETGRWEKAKRLRKLMAKRGFMKTPGCSWVQPA
ncbi:Pentatricopeptide repeat-containing protein [Ananas comosus]|uniref:Pentatricopeptide repeat-containing protein n=1 Tax=Ananas comosus TaxID=4615 RepID=A0A199VIT8_ANACO|nr:Pentatricopeptide repeat-containing protein [Ananas comosus]